MPSLNENERRNKRNRYGVKSSIDCYRTINGEPYIAWLSHPSPERISAYRAAGIRCRRFGVELFVHETDRTLAELFDAKARS